MLAQKQNPLREWRKQHGLTLHAAAVLVGTSRQVWFAWENGHARPSARFMPKIREVTGGRVTADAFFGGEA